MTNPVCLICTKTHEENRCPDAPPCSRCGSNHQVWVNQISGKLTCHRAGCHASVDPKPQTHSFSFKAYDGPEFPSHPIKALAEKFAQQSAQLTEFYLRAWIAETGLKPSECELVVEHTPTGSKTYARKRT